LCGYIGGFSRLFGSAAGIPVVAAAAAAVLAALVAANAQSFFCIFNHIPYRKRDRNQQDCADDNGGGVIRNP
jgi:hypothetical protein